MSGMITKKKKEKIALVNLDNVYWLFMKIKYKVACIFEWSYYKALTRVLPS